MTAPPEATAHKRSLPPFVLDVVGDRAKVRVLVACSLAILAAGLVPRTLSPGMPSVQAALRTQPEIQSMVVFIAFLASANSVAGGVVGDIWRRPSALIAGLSVMLVGELLSLILPAGPLFYVVQIAVVIGAGVVIAFAVGAVALAYDGAARATSLGVVYGVYGLGTATAPALTLMLGALGPYWPAYVVAAAVAAIGLYAVRRWRPELPGALPTSRSAAVVVGLWGIALLAVITGLLAFGGPGNELIQFSLIIAGGGLLAGLAIQRRLRPREFNAMAIRPRQMAAAVFVGGVVGFTQTIPLVLLPAVFLYVFQYSPPIMSTIAIAPFAIALFAAGPVAGILLPRYSARAILLTGTGMLGIGAIALGGAMAVFGSTTSYLWLILPLAAVGAGFVISTTVRTAIVFAATPRGLPATAAGYNEASVALGARVGIIASTLIVVVVAANSLTRALQGRPDIDARLAEFQSLVARLNLPDFRTVVGTTSVSDRPLYAAAYLDGVWAAIVLGGIIAIVGAIVAWFMVGPGDPLRTVFDMQDERATKELNADDLPTS